MRVAIKRTEHTAADLRRLAGRSDDAAVARRLLALILDGHKRADAAGHRRTKGFAGDRQALRDWVHRYNANGVRGLVDRHGGGVARRLSAEQEAAVAGWIRTGPDLARDKLVRWRCADIQVRLAELFGVALHERSVGKSGRTLALLRLHRLRFSHVSTRPRHLKADPLAQEPAQRGQSPHRLGRRVAGTARLRRLKPADYLRDQLQDARVQRCSPRQRTTEGDAGQPKVVVKTAF